MILKVLPFPPYQAAYLVGAWNCDYQLNKYNLNRVNDNKHLQ